MLDCDNLDSSILGNVEKARVALSSPGRHIGLQQGYKVHQTSQKVVHLADVLCKLSFVHHAQEFLAMKYIENTMTSPGH